MSIFDGKKTHSVEVAMPEEALQTLQALAEADGYESVPHLARELFESYVETRLEALARYEAIVAKGLTKLRKNRAGDAPEPEESTSGPVSPAA